jgi:acyl carrier protein
LNKTHGTEAPNPAAEGDRRGTADHNEHNDGERAMSVDPEIYAKVTNLLAEALVVDKADITPAVALQRDLGADSLDLVEIMFRLEQEFEIEVLRGELFPQSILRIGPEFVQDGKLTDKGLAELHARMPLANLSEFEKDPELSRVGDLFTAELVTRYVAGKLDARSN